MERCVRYEMLAMSDLCKEVLIGSIKESSSGR